MLIGFHKIIVNIDKIIIRLNLEFFIELDKFVILKLDYFVIPNLDSEIYDSLLILASDFLMS